MNRAVVSLFRPLCAVALLAAGCGKGRVETWQQAKTAAPAAAAAAPDGSEGDALWAKRDDRASLEAAIAAYQKALEAAPESTELLVKLARATYFLADAHLRQDKEAYLNAFEKGVDYAERALTSASPEFKKRVQDGDVVKDAVESVGKEGIAALYWYSSNLGKWAKAKGFATTLGNKDTIKAVMGRAYALDPSYFHGGPDRYFGAFYSVAPTFAGGDLGKSEEHFNKSLELAPYYIGTKVLMAENLAVKKQDSALFRKLLTEVLETNVNDPVYVERDLVPEVKVEQAKAKELLAQIDEKF